MEFLAGTGGFFPAALENEAAALENLLLPAVHLAGLDAVLVAQVGDGLFVHQVGFEDGNLLFRQLRIIPWVVVIWFVLRSGPGLTRPRNGRWIRRARAL